MANINMIKIFPHTQYPEESGFYFILEYNEWDIEYFDIKSQKWIDPEWHSADYKYRGDYPETCELKRGWLYPKIDFDWICKNSHFDVNYFFDSNKALNLALGKCQDPTHVDRECQKK